MDQVADAESRQISGAHRLLCGDCLTELPGLAASTVDVVVTSPPYNLGLSYRGYDDRRTENEYWIG